MAGIGHAPDDERLTAALCRGDEDPFSALADRHSVATVRLAMVYVRRAAAEEAVHETASRLRNPHLAHGRDPFDRDRASRRAPGPETGPRSRA